MKHGSTARVTVLSALAVTVAMVMSACTSNEGAGSSSSSASTAQASASASAAPVGALSQSQVDRGLAGIDRLVAAVMNATGVPGVAVAVVHDNSEVFARGYGVRTLGHPEKVDPNTVFQIASLSKPVSSTALASLVGKKKFSWDDPVHKYLPSLTFSDPYVTDHVTFADLYAHRSGLPGDTGNRLEILGFTRNQILDRFRYVPMNPFRSTYSYSNFGLTAAGEAAAKADGTSFANLMQRELFDPAGMTSSSARYADFLARRDRASLTVRIHGTWQLGPARDPDAQAPAGGISSSANDLATWMRLQLAGGTLDGKPVVDPTALTQTHTPHILTRPLQAPDAPAAEYGLGWNVEVDHLGYVRWSHSGAFSYGASTTAVLLPAAQLGVVVLTNGSPIGAAEAMADDIVDDIVTGAPTRDWLEFWSQVFAPLLGPNPDLGTPPVHPQPAHAPSAYVGTYTNPYYGSFEVRSDRRGRLRIIAGPKRLVYSMTHWDANTFTYVEGSDTPDFLSTLTFRIGPDGKARALDVGGLPGVNLLRRTGP